MRNVLWLAAGYNFAWGALVMFFPLAPFRWAGMEPPRYPEIWQCLGMVVGVYGLAYALAARDPVRHWPIVLAGLIGKVLGPIGFMNAVWRGRLPWVAGWTIVANDVVWWLPFALILIGTRRSALGPTRVTPHFNGPRYDGMMDRGIVPWHSTSPTSSSSTRASKPA